MAELNPTIEVTITGHNHPHRGETGHMKIIDNRLQFMKVAGMTMWLIVLDNCPHGVNESYVPSTQFELSGVAKKRMLEFMKMLYESGEL